METTMQRRLELEVFEASGLILNVRAALVANPVAWKVITAVEFSSLIEPERMELSSRSKVSTVES